MASAVFTLPLQATQVSGRQVGGCAGLLPRLVSFVVCGLTTEHALISSTHHLYSCQPVKPEVLARMIKSLDLSSLHLISNA